MRESDGSRPPSSAEGAESYVERLPMLAPAQFAQRGVGDVEILVADLSSQQQTAALASQAAACGPFDTKILDTGVARGRRELTVERFEVEAATNHLSPFLLLCKLVHRSLGPRRRRP